MEQGGWSGEEEEIGKTRRQRSAEGKEQGASSTEQGANTEQSSEVRSQRSAKGKSREHGAGSG